MSEPLESSVRLVLVLRFIDREDYETLQLKLREARQRERVIRQRRF